MNDWYGLSRNSDKSHHPSLFGSKQELLCCEDVRNTLNFCWVVFWMNESITEQSVSRTATNCSKEIRKLDSKRRCSSCGDDPDIDDTTPKTKRKRRPLSPHVTNNYVRDISNTDFGFFRWIYSLKTRYCAWIFDFLFTLSIKRMNHSWQKTVSINLNRWLFELQSYPGKSLMKNKDETHYQLQK